VSLVEFGPLSLIPPLLAIVLAMATRQVLPALFAGIWVAALMVTLAEAVGPLDVLTSPLTAVAKSFEWLIENATDSWNATILAFDFIIGAFVGVLYASGAMHAVAYALSRRIRSARAASLSTYALGLVIFFDDYANTVVVGNTTRPLTDKLRVSRELLSYIVDSTAAPVAGLFIVSTWIGYEVGLIRDALEALAEEAGGGITPDPGQAMWFWLMSVPYRYYSILALLLVLIVILTRRHYGPMLEAEHRAVRTAKVLRDGAQPLMPTETVLGEPMGRAGVGVFVASVLALVVVTILGLWITGGSYAAAEIEEYKGLPWYMIPFSVALMNADAATALLWGSIAGYFTASLLALATKTMGFRTLMEYTVKGMYLMVYANSILLLAWSLKTATEAVGTAEYVVATATAAGIPALVVPAVVFAASTFISFTTGTSWGTFAIMMPIAVPLAWKLAVAQGLPEPLVYTVTFASIASVFAGGIFGDHCSPISDTTIMSSMFTAADHIDHVNTQIPYALTAMAVSAVLFSLFAAGVTDWRILLPVGFAILVVLHRLLNHMYAARKGLPPVVPNYVVEQT
jgi:NhaC family Na+:H+ antiporter